MVIVLAVTVFAFRKEAERMTKGTDRRRRSESEWRALVERQKASGLSQIEFCQQEGIARSTFEVWRRRIASRSVAGQFVELAMPGEGGGEWEVELTLPLGMVLRLRG
jgi:hypothetical protein